MGFRKLSENVSNNDRICEELRKAGVPSIRTTVLSKAFRIRIYGMLGEWIFYRRVDHWVVKPLHTVSSWSPSRIKRLIGKRDDLKCDLITYATEFQLYSEDALKRFVKEISRRSRKS